MNCSEPHDHSFVFLQTFLFSGQLSTGAHATGKIKDPFVPRCNKNASWTQATLFNSTSQGGGVPRVTPRGTVDPNNKKVCRKTNDGREVRYRSYRLWFPESLVWDVGDFGRGFDTDRFCVLAAILGQSCQKPKQANRAWRPRATRSLAVSNKILFADCRILVEEGE